MNSGVNKPLSKKAEIELCLSFLKNFSNHEGTFYMSQLHDIANIQRTSLHVYLDHLEQFQGDSGFVERILKNTQRYLDVFACAADELMPEPSSGSTIRDVSDVWTHQRVNRIREHAARERELSGAAADSTSVPSCPPAQLRKYEIRIFPRKSDAALPMREIKSSTVGSLVQFRGVVVKATDVQPLMSVQTYVCTVCGSETYQLIQTKQYTPQTQCASNECRRNNSKGKLYPQTRGSKFRAYQELRLQEQASEVPVAHVPRSVSVRVYGDLVRTCKPGDQVTCTGIFLPMPYLGFRAIRAGLVTETYVEAMFVDSEKKNYADMQLTEQEQIYVEELADDAEIYDKLAQSISPEIHGHHDTKKALLLAMIGGVTRVMPDGLKVRGDVNVLLVGDPGMAKSQLLKHITKLSPRSAYTTGKGSSGVGLTAAVVRDPLSGDMTLEGGALVLADQGVCCIDEFDKMDENDRTAIHEVMEQQTVSIAKAGITTSLNARTTVIAAANPAYGRFRENKSISENLNMPAALLSRFDLVFVLLDRPTVASDEELARHVTYVHMKEAAPALPFKVLSPNIIRHYISRCKTIVPTVPKTVADSIASSYCALRSETNVVTSESQRNSRDSFVTARSLLSILRLSQAIARVYMRDTVHSSHVEEAIRLIAASKNTNVEVISKTDPVADLYKVVLAHVRATKNTTVSMSELRTIAFSKGYTQEHIDKFLHMYQENNLLSVNRSRDHVSLIM